MIKQMGLQFTELENESADAPFSVASGAGKIFGTTGGVTEAVLRRLAEDKSYNTIREISYTGVRGFEGTKEATIDLDGREVKIAVVHGLANAGRLLDRIRSGEASYDFVEVMACRRGCIMGGGQPSGAGPRTRRSRMEGMYNADASSNVRFSEETRQSVSCMIISLPEKNIGCYIGICRVILINTKTQISRNFKSFLLICV